MAQVRGRNGIGIIRKLEYDLEYVNHFGFKYDVKILFETIKVILGKKDSEITEGGINEEIGILKNTKKNAKKNKNKAVA